MERRMSVCVNSQGVEIDGRTYPLYSGSVHYWRLDRDKWSDVLDRVVEMGFRFVCTYIPWSVHEVADGEYDFGRNGSSKDIGAFIDLCAEKRLLVLVRPGPHINAEITYFGYPERLFRREELLARTVDGTLAYVPAAPRFFPAPCYASNEFYTEVGGYFDALCPILKDRVYPRGPVVGVQADNEMSLFFRTSPFDLDYADPSIELYRKFLGGKYGEDIDRLNEAYGSRHEDFDEVKPPRSFDATSIGELPYYLDWTEYKELYVFYGIHRIARMLRERGLENVFYFHNYPTAYPVSPFHVPKMESQIDVAGVDLYRSRKDYNGVKTAARFLAGTSRLPFIPELGSGGWPWWKPLFLKDQELATRAALMNGVKAANFYMLVDRERWYGAPVTRDGRKRDGYFDFYCNLNKFLSEHKFHEYAMRSDVLLLSIADYERLEQMQSLLPPLPNLEPAGGLPPDWFVPKTPLRGLRDPVGALYKRQWRAFWMGFSQAGFPVTLADSSVEQGMLEMYPVVVAPSFDFMNLGLQKRLLLYTLKGGVLVLGPRAPLLNEKMVQESKFAPHLLRPVERRERHSVGGLVVERADIFRTDKPLFREEGGEACAYWRPTEKGKIVHLGFVFQDYTGIERSPGVAGVMKKIAALAGLEPRYPASDTLVETVVHERGEAKLLFVANPTGEDRLAGIELPGGERLADTDTGEVLAGPAAEVELPAYSVRIFRVEKQD